MSSPLPSNMALCTVRGRYGQWISVPGQANPQFQPFVGLRVRFTAAYPFVTNTTATPSPVVQATAPREFVTDVAGYMSDPLASNTRDCQVVASDDPDIYPSGWKYLITFTGVGASHFRAFRTPLPSGATVDMAILTPQRIGSSSPATAAEIAAANAASSAAAALAAVASIQRGVAGGVAPLDADGDVNNAAGVKVLPGGGGGTATNVPLSGITGMSPLAKLFNADTTDAAMRSRISAGTSNLLIGSTTGTVPDAATTNTELGLRALDTTVLHKTGDETKSGVLTLTNAPVIPDALANDQPYNKGQVDTLLSNGGVVAGFVAWAGITDKPATFPSSDAPLCLFAPYPARPATPRVVFFFGTAPPAPDGVIGGGGGMVPDFDQWFETP